MATPTENSSSSPAERSPLFNAPRPLETRQDRRFPSFAVGVAFLAIVVLVAVSSLLTRKHASTPAPNTIQPLAPYAANLGLSAFAMSESTSLSGGKSTYIDGRIANRGPAIITGITVQALFANDTGMPPQLETESLNLIRTRELYVDTQPVSAAPLQPGAEAEFRLIFENLNGNWNGQQPEIRVVRVTTR